MVNIAVLVSGGGTNLQAILDAQARGDIHNGRVSVVVSSNDKAYALERAKQAGVPGVVRRKKDYASGAEYCRALAQFLQEQNIGLIVLAGFMTVLDEDSARTLRTASSMYIRHSFRRSAAMASMDCMFMRRRSRRA